MNRVDFCRLARQADTDADPRVRTAIGREQQESIAIYDNRKSETRTVSDLEPFSNPCTDSRILHSSPERNVNTVFAGIDIETPERLLAGRLNETGAVVDEVCGYLLWMVESRFLSLFSAACPG